MPRPSGSSPPARGPRLVDASDAPPVRLIPACAGTTGRGCDETFHYQAHPRLRGDHFAARKAAIARIGSSPPARGPRATAVAIVDATGLIPACAGTTLPRAFYCPFVGAHPRLRGDHGFPSGQSTSILGSSPPARGPLLGAEPTAYAGGLIPACAGTTVPVQTVGNQKSAHPRLRGDHTARFR